MNLDNIRAALILAEATISALEDIPQDRPELDNADDGARKAARNLSRLLARLEADKLDRSRLTIVTN